MKIDSGNS